MQDLAKDLAVLLSTDKRIFDKLIQNANFCICDYLETAALNNEQECQINIGIGILKLKIEENAVRYSFIPSTTLETEVIDTLEAQQNLLVSTVDTALVAKLNKLYDTLL